MVKNRTRNVVIGELLKRERLSYEVIAEMIGTTRNVVAGVAFRLRHPCRKRICSPNSPGPNKIGTGYRQQTYYPEKTALNTR